ncbi:MAG: metallophosphoesterase [Chloroflexota bacterium]
MSRYKRIFISDIHLSSQALYDSGHARYKPDKHRSRLLNFLDKQVLAKSGQIKDLVLLGDIFDNWSCPADEVPPTYQDILAANSEELGRLQEAVEKGIKVFFVAGNHDYDLPKNLIETAVPGLKVIPAYKGTGRTHAEHGHECTPFNRLDFHSDPVHGRPVGYYIARLHATTGEEADSIGDMLLKLERTLNVLTSTSSLVETIVRTLAVHAEVDHVVMPDHTEKSIETIVRQYQGLFDQPQNRVLGVATAINEFELGFHADRMSRTQGFNVVLFGHTHRRKLDKDFLFVEDRIYANTGSWCDDEASCVIVEKYPLKSGCTVKLVEVRGDGKIRDTDTKRL